jgi:hypothetical protein
MRKNWLLPIFTLALAVAFTACEDLGIGPKGSDVNASNRGGKGTDNIANEYNIAFESDGYTFTYTITKTNKAKAVSHFVVDLNNCGLESASRANVLSASINGVPVTLQDTEGKGTGCNITSENFVKFDEVPSGNVIVLSFTLDREFTITETSGWIKAGTNCSEVSISGPGCPVNEACSMSQGYYFGNGAKNNGAYEVWMEAGGVSLGGHVYAYEDGKALWDAKGTHTYGVVRAFFQFSALQLSETPLSGDVLDAYQAIETYMAGKTKLTVENASSLNASEMGEAAGLIGNWIDANHCQED